MLVHAEGTPGLDLDAEIDRLYAMGPEGFVRARDDLARRLRAAGRSDDVATVKRLRRPTAAAWALNQLPRRAGEDVRRLVRHGEELRRLQDELLAGGDRDRLRVVARHRREAIARLADAALEVLADDGRPGAEGHRDEVVATLEAASLQPEAGAALLEGRLTTALAPSPGFGLLDAPAPSPRPPPPPSARPPGQVDDLDGVDGAARAARMAEAREVATDAAALADRRRAEVAALADEAVAARHAVEVAEAEVARLTGELERARRGADEAGRRARTAAARVADGERVAAAAQAQARAAADALARLEAG